MNGRSTHGEREAQRSQQAESDGQSDDFYQGELKTFDACEHDNNGAVALPSLVQRGAVGVNRSVGQFMEMVS